MSGFVRRRSAQTKPQQVSWSKIMHGLSERDICSKFITPALTAAGWNLHTQIREEVNLTAGRIVVRGKLTSRGKQKRADYILYHKPNIPIAVIEAKDASHSVGAGMQQALEYAEMIDVPVAFSTNGKGILVHDRSSADGSVGSETRRVGKECAHK